MKSDIEIAQNATLQPVGEIAAALGIAQSELVPYGRNCAKVSLDIMKRCAENPAGRLVLVTAMTPTAKGNGKTTTAIGLAQALAKCGKRAVVAIREPSMGPCMGVKGGAAGGGYSQVLPMEEINLHFTGDLHAVTAAHNLCAAMIDNHLHHQAQPAIHPRRVVWKRAIDMNDRSLRNITIGLLEEGRNGVMREDGFEITAASEVMAILCLSNSLRECKERLGNLIVGYDTMRKPVTARDIGVNGAMATLLKHAILPNLVQTIEGTPAFVHGGPFANIAHGCNTLFATKMALKLGEYIVTEAGFGADLGAEKFFDIKCRTGGLHPSAAVLVVTGEATHIHGVGNIMKHVESLRLFNIPVIISINRFFDDDPDDLVEIQNVCRDAGVDAVITDFREGGGEGGIELAEKIARIDATAGGPFRFLYDLEMPLKEKVRTIAQKIYGADDVDFLGQADKKIQQIENLGYGNLPVCMAKTPLSLTDNPKISGRPHNFRITISSAKVSAGAGFVVVYTGDIMTMPGLPKLPAALSIDIDDHGKISGLF